MTTYLHQRITFFDSDDVTPLLGAVDGSGNVTDPSFSTDPAHARPYLEFSEDTGQADISFADGSATIGQVNLTILDKRRTADDQSTGIFTYLQASATTRNTQVLRRRVLWEGLASDGVTWDTLYNGILSHIGLNDDLVSYTLALRDIRERERDVRLFISNNDAVADAITGDVTVTKGTTVFPYVGPMEGWGHPTVYDDVTGRVQFDPTNLVPTVLPVYGVKGTWYNDPLGGSYVLFDQSDPANFALIIPDDVKVLLAKYGQASIDGQGSIKLADGVFGPSYQTWDQYYYKGVIPQWGTTPTGPWNTLRIMPANSGPYFPFGKSVFEVVQVQPLKQWTPFSFFPGLTLTVPDKTAAPVNFVKSVKLIPSGSDPSPTNGQVIFVRFISNMQPEENVPKFIEYPNFGEFLQDIYDGVHSDPQVPPNVLYDQNAMDDMKAATPPVLAIVTEPVDDMRGWNEENIFKPNGYAPALSGDGVVRPVKDAIPAFGTSLALLDDTNVDSAGWEHGEDNAINKVSFTYQRDYVATLLSAPYGINITSEQDVIIEDWDVDSLGLFNAKVLEFKPVTCHSVLVANGPFAQVPNVTAEVGWRLARARMADVLLRFGSGAPVCNVVARATDASIYLLEVGDWVILQLSWLPDYYTRTRGCNRLMQITSVKKTDPITRTFTLVDGGAYLSTGFVCPTVSNIQQDAQGRVSVDVTAIPSGAIARLEFAVGATQPPDTSGAWMLMVRTTSTGTFYTSPQPPGVKVWVRWRSEQVATQPSTWCGPLSVTMANIAQMIDAKLSIGVDGTPRVNWAGLSTTLGVRIKYQRHANGTPVPTVLGSSLDFDVNTNGSGGIGYTDLPFQLDPLEQITVQVVGYPGWTGSAVSGTAGYASQFLTAQYLAAPTSPPTIIPTVTITGIQADVTLKIDSTISGSTMTVQVRDSNNVVWDLVTSGVDSTPLAVAPGTVVNQLAWFHQASTFAQILNDIPLSAGVVKVYYAQAEVVGAPGVVSGWIPINMQGAFSSAVSNDEVIESTVASAAGSTDFPNARGLEDSDDGALTWDRSVADTIKPIITPVAFPGPGGAMSVFQTVVETTASLADGAGQTILLNIAPTVSFQNVQTDYAAWIRVYDTLAALMGDIARTYGTDISWLSPYRPIWESGNGLGSQPLSLPFRPDVVGHNNDTTRIGRFYMRVVNKSGATHAITTTIKYLPLEGDPSTVPPDVTGGGLLWRLNAQLITPVADGTETLTIANAGSLGGNFTNGSMFGSGPKYKTSQINGHPVIRFASIGGNTRAYDSPTTGLVTPTEVHIFAVLQTAGGGDAWCFGGSNNPTNFPNAAGNVSDASASTAAKTVPITNNPTIPFLYHAHSKSALWEAFVGLAQVYTTGTNTVGFSQYTIGGYLAGGFFASIFAGDIGEFRFYSGALSDDDILGIKLQMQADWGISL